MNLWDRMLKKQETDYTAFLEIIEEELAKRPNDTEWQQSVRKSLIQTAAAQERLELAFQRNSDDLNRKDQK